MTDLYPNNFKNIQLRINKVTREQYKKISEMTDEEKLSNNILPDDVFIVTDVDLDAVDMPIKNIPTEPLSSANLNYASNIEYVNNSIKKLSTELEDKIKSNNSMIRTWVTEKIEPSKTSLKIRVPTPDFKLTLNKVKSIDNKKAEIDWGDGISEKI